MWTTNTNTYNRDFRVGDWVLRSDTLCVVAMNGPKTVVAKLGCGPETLEPGIVIEYEAIHRGEKICRRLHVDAPLSVRITRGRG